MSYEFSTYLFASPGIFEGAGRLVDFGNTLFGYNVSETETAADWRALMADCRAIASPFAKVAGEPDCVKAFEGCKASRSRH
jgi:hypothetical protein